jgi:hypothetical protein
VNSTRRFTSTWRGGRAVEGAALEMLFRAT